MNANDLVNDLIRAEKWHIPPWEVSGKNPKKWRDVYKMLDAIYSEVYDQVNPRPK